MRSFKGSGGSGIWVTPWLAALDRVRHQAEALAELKGPPSVVLDRLGRDFESLAPDSVAALKALVKALEDLRVPPDRLELDLGFGRGIGFYSQMVFEIVAQTPGGPVEVCGGGRYDGLARVFGSDRDDRGAGFAFGLERLDAVLRAQGDRSESEWWDKGAPTLVVATSPARWKEAADAAALMRSSGARAILEANWQGRAIFERARALGATHVLIVGLEEGENYFIWLGELGEETRRVKVDGYLGLAALMSREEPS